MNEHDDEFPGDEPDEVVGAGSGGAGGALAPECARIDPDLAELALGALTGKERVTALAHLEDCSRCSAEVDELAAAADQLLHLAPAAEPRWASKPASSSVWGCDRGRWGGGHGRSGGPSWPWP